MTNINLTLAIVFALLYNIILFVSKGVQKYGIEGLSIETVKQWKQRPELKRNFLIWGAGSLGTIVATIFQAVAQPFTPNSSFLPAFGGIGLMCLVIFSYYFLHEKIKRIEVVGIILVIITTITFGFVAEDIPAVSVDYGTLIIFVITVLGTLFLIGIWSICHNYKGHAIIWGAIAGFFSGLGIALSQTAAISGDRTILGMLLTPDLWIAFMTGQGAFWFTQYGFKHGNATVVATLYNTLMLGVPVIVDILVLKQQLPFIQILMLIGIGIGVVLLTAFRQDSQQK